MTATPRTAVLLMAYGTPRHRDELLAYYTDIRRGRPPSAQQLADLAARYEAIGGLSPLADRTAAQRDALQAMLDTTSPGEFEVVLGLKHAAPRIESAVDDVVGRRFSRLVGLVAAPHYSGSSVGQYLSRAREAAHRHGVAFVGIESWATERALVDFTAAQVVAKLATLPENSKVLFTGHSLPQRIIDEGDRYPDELRATAAAVAGAAGLRHWNQWALAWQSASRTPEPWLGPDILGVIDELAAAENDANATRGVLVCALGFVADHLEVLYDVDVLAAARAKSHGLAFARTACVNDDASVMAALAARVILATDQFPSEAA
ncbi:MAG: ferrochelatase [Actinobacteria bacterium]|nr:ferrochelatase [Actinomycetota bacterium]